jgi:LacI family transcriptional regulator
MATIADVARIARVSISTVSHVINETRPVGDDTRARVLEAIAETGYQRDGVARALRRSRTDSVGLVVSDTGQRVFAEMVRGVEHEARRAGFTLLLANSAEDSERERESIQALRERRVDGLLVGQVSGSDHSLVERMRAARTPLVLIDRLTVPDVDQVGVQNLDAMRQLTEHLLERGHTRIAYVGGDMLNPVLDERRDGFLEALATSPDARDQSRVIEGTSRVVDTADAMLPLLRGRDRPTAIIGAGMMLGLGAMSAIRQADLRWPEDIAFVVFDEPPYAELFSPRLTTVVQPAFAIGREAMRLLLRRISQPDAPPRTVRLKPALVHGESCGCRPGTSAGWEVVPTNEPG